MKLHSLPMIPLAVAAAVLAGCSSNVPLDEKAGAPVETRTPATGGSAANAAGASQSQIATVDLAKNAAPAAPADRIVYFDFDSFVIKDEFKPMLAGHAKTLAADHGKRMVVEGHTDERGSREYNLALGQKRSEAVVKSLELLGAADDQLEAVSFGEERPAVDGHDETAWAKNRRAELKYR